MCFVKFFFCCCRFCFVCTDAVHSKRRPNAFIPIIIMSWYQIRLLLLSFVFRRCFFVSLILPWNCVQIVLLKPRMITQWHHLTAKPTYITRFSNCSCVCTTIYFRITKTKLHNVLYFVCVQLRWQDADPKWIHTWTFQTYKPTSLTLSNRTIKMKSKWSWNIIDKNQI